MLSVAILDPLGWISVLLFFGKWIGSGFMVREYSATVSECALVSCARPLWRILTCFYSIYCIFLSKLNGWVRDNKQQCRARLRSFCTSAYGFIVKYGLVGVRVLPCLYRLRTDNNVQLRQRTGGHRWPSSVRCTSSVPSRLQTENDDHPRRTASLRTGFL